MIAKESVLDQPKANLDPIVWQISNENAKPQLTYEAQSKIDKLVNWVQEQYHFNNLSVYIIGSICSNSYTEKSDIDIDFCTTGSTEDDNDEDVVREFGWAFKKNVIENYFNQFPEESKIGTHPFEVYFNPNPFQCFMSVGCYNVLEKKWEIGPELKGQSFDPVSEYYDDAMKQVDKILKDIRDKIFSLYEKAFVAKKSNDQKFKDEQEDEIMKLLEDASDLFHLMKKVRSNYQKPTKSKEEALKRRKDKKQHIVDAAFKFLEKFGYIQILKDVISIYDEIEDGKKIQQDQIFDSILNSIKENISLKQLQDSEDSEFVKRLEETDLDESAKDLIKISAIAAMMAISGLLPATTLAKELTKAKKQNQAMTVNSQAAKNAITNATIENEMIGDLSKTNTINAVAQVLWKEARGEGIDGLKAIASVILNRTGNDPSYITDVLKQSEAFSCMNGYNGGWIDKTYRFFVPWKAIKDVPSNLEIWEDCKDIASQLVNKKFTSTIGNRNSYLNKDTASKTAKDTWGKKCDLQIGKHHFGYLKEHDPKYVKPGTMTTWKKLNKKGGKYIVVKSGQTLSKIAKDNKTDIANIMKLNPQLKDPNKISIGQKLRIA